MPRTATGPPPAAEKPKSEKRRWAPRLWLGGRFVGWMRILVRNRFAVGWQYSYIALIDTIICASNSCLRLVQNLIYGGRLRRTQVTQQPLFIIGHWRSGTTMLHEMLSLDPRHTYPTTYQCFSPNHFLLTEGMAQRWLGFLMPERRPMDNMATGWDRPQEDEFALCNLGVPSPYWTIAFPNRPPQNPEYLDLEGISEQAMRRWKQTLLRFLQVVTFKNPGKRVILKSPTHTCRVKTLLEMFPDARFVHIVRDPYVIYPSTLNVWRSLYQTHGLQRPTFQGLEEHVLETFLRMHETLEKTRGLISPNRFFEVRYEDLVADPVSQMRTLYETLELGEFDNVLPLLEEYLGGVGDYRVNKYELTDQERAEVQRRWKPYFERYGYDLQGGGPQDAHPPKSDVAAG